MPRLFAEYHDPTDSESHPTRHGRAIFLARVGQVAPRVLAALRDDVLPAFRAVWEDSHPTVRTQFFLRGWAALSRIPEEMRPPQLPAFVTALDDWANRWHLTDPWILDAALSTLRWWTEHPEALDARLHWWAPWGTVAPLPPPLILQWSPMTRTWAGFKTDAEKEIQRYRDDVERWAREHGLEPAPEKRARHDDDAGVHYEWLARWQVQEWTYAEIASEYVVKGEEEELIAVPTVRKAVRGAAEHIGLTPRPE